ncbi:tetratricopeptide repeat protein [Argonema antarcticum]|uniref:tetratricopeptide repeat protein n=1 Tax=Argonema antarcticum TaxID=2942763 RepID=UPI00201122A8|nr:tetratricopeptide repeat protein [Argonema antarcticum A004/B2]
MFEEAIASYREAIRINPNLVEAHQNLGFALQDRGQLAEANAEYQAAINLYPEESAVHRRLAYLLYR